MHTTLWRMIGSNYIAESEKHRYTEDKCTVVLNSQFDR